MRRNQDAAKIGEVSFNFNKQDMEEEKKEYGVFAAWIDVGLAFLGIGAIMRLIDAVKSLKRG